MWPLDLSKGLVSVKEYFDSDKKKCFNAADYDSKANKFCCFHLYKLIENSTFGDQMISILWNGFIFSIKHDLARSGFQFWLKIGDKGEKISRKKLARRQPRQFLDALASLKTMLDIK